MTLRHTLRDRVFSALTVIQALTLRDWIFFVFSMIAIFSDNVLLGVLFLNIFFIRILEKEGYLERWNATKVLGFILMIRTNKGQKILETISRPRKFWRMFGEFSIWIGFIALFFTTMLVILTFISLFNSSRDRISIESSEVLLIPGVTSGIPVFWPLMALIVALIIHEYGHGILMRAHGMRVRSFGLLIFSFIPIGAFAEPEYTEVLKAPKRERMRIYAAGPAVNLVFSIILVSVLAVGVSGINPTIQGAYSPAIVVDGPANESGLEPYDMIIEANNKSISSGDDLRNILNSSKAGDILVLTILKYNTTNGVEWDEEKIIQVTLGDRFEQLRSSNISEENIELLGVSPGDAFLGVGTNSNFESSIRNSDHGKNRLMGPFYPNLTVDERFFASLIYPINLLSMPFEFNGEIMGNSELKMLDFGIIELFLIEGIFWFLWINFLLGFANLIPVIPFDGGHIMRDTINSTINWIADKSGIIHSQKAEILATKTSNISSLLFFFAFLIPIIYGLIN
tara:strand:+ start:1060 stop:2592 length:1533 start_codon:yes stop_codon:yes gene_type:complete